MCLPAILYNAALHPMPTEQITVDYNELRSEILLLLDLKATRDSQEFELQSLKLAKAYTKNNTFKICTNVS